MTTQRPKEALHFTIPARYYSRGSVDWEGPVPAKGYRGEKVKHVTLTTANTAITCVHPENYGYPGQPQVFGEAGTLAYYDLWFARYRTVIEQRLVPLFDAARAAGLRILYIVNGWKTAENYPQYREIAARVDLPPPTWQAPANPHTEWRAERMDEILGKNYREDGDCDIAPPLAAQPQDWLTAWSQQASTLFNENGIWNILFTGFEAASCLLNISGGVLPMAHLGYRCFIVEDCALALETRETRGHEEIKRAFFSAVQLSGYCHIVNSKDIIEALTKATGGLQ